METALVFGITGQDGAYLSHYLLLQGYRVVGTSRDSLSCDRSRLSALGIENDVEIYTVLPSDFNSVLRSIERFRPCHVYNLSGLTSVGFSYELPLEAASSIATATINILESIRFLDGDIRFFNAGSSECFGDTIGYVADENTILKPVSPYGVAKAAAFWQVDLYRSAYGIYCCTGILSNHESPLRSDRFVTRKIVTAARDIAACKSSSLCMGRVDILRDWGWAPDYVRAMHMMLDAPTPQDYIIATGQSYSLRSLARAIFEFHGLVFDDYCVDDSSLVRPNDISASHLSPKRIQANLQWSPTIDFPALVSKLCRSEVF